MPASYSNIQRRLKVFDFKGLFTQELMWNNYPTRELSIPMDGTTYTLTPVAEQRGMAVYICVPPSGVPFPNYATRRKIDTQVSKTVREHIIVFHDIERTAQIWQWVRRESGKPSACREQIFYSNQTGDALIQKIQRIAFSLEEVNGLSILDVTGRVGTVFDVDKLTKKFYELFEREHDTFQKFVRGIPVEDLKRWYVSVMLNRLMFIYFVQKKGFLNRDLNYLQTKLAESKGRGKDKFYREFLCLLFFEGFAKEKRSQKTSDLLGDIPYLNGGLFLKHQIEEWHGTTIDIPDSAFEKILRFFESYDWHLDERPARKGNEVNPDVLGYVFEKYINQREMGAYYTKEDITSYISQNTILPAVVDMVRKTCSIALDGQQSAWRLLKVEPARYIHASVLHGMGRELPKEISAGISNIGERGRWNRPAPPEFALPTETWREVIVRRAGCKEVLSKLTSGGIQNIEDMILYNLDVLRFLEEAIANCEEPHVLRAFRDAIWNLSVLDPTCGSGAFLFAALNVLERLYDSCLVRMQAFIDDFERSGKRDGTGDFRDFGLLLDEMHDKTQHPSPRYFVLKSIILNNIYGVDIMEEATEICKLRLFLKLVAQVNPGERIEPLPDIDFNIRAGNTLVGFASEGELDHVMGSNLDFDNKKSDVTKRAEEAESAFERFREMQVLPGIEAEVLATAKTELRKQLSILHTELDHYLSGEYGIKASDKKGFDSWRRSHRPFHWYVEFYKIMKNGGFDAIIGNPPYVEVSDIEDSYRIRNLRLTVTGNLYSICVERFTSLVRNGGHMGVIVPISSISTSRMVPLMSLLTKSYEPLFVSNFAVRPGKLFVGTDMNLTVLVGRNARSTNDGQIFSTSYNRWATEFRPFLFDTLKYTESTFQRETACIPKCGSEIERRILQKLMVNPPLATICTRQGGDQIFYHSGGRYFRKCLLEKLSNEYKELNVQAGLGKTVISLLSSSLYYFYWLSVSDCYHVTKRDVETMPFAATLKSDSHFENLSGQLLEDLWKNAETRTRVRADGSTQKEVNFYVGASKAIIDKIDRRLARHYNLTEDELDFILNYDIKFRSSLDD
jgi:hypothetical protein